jgi:hypothetical protein
MNYTAVDINEAPQYLIELVANMELRPIDVLECELAGSPNPRIALLRAMQCSLDTYCKIGVNTVTGLPEFIYGVASTDDVTIGAPWLLATEDFKITPDWLKACRREVFPEMNATFPILRNFIHKENRESIAWLKWLGFEFHDIPVTFREDGAPAPMYLFVKLGGSPCVTQ